MIKKKQKFLGRAECFNTRNSMPNYAVMITIHRYVLFEKLLETSTWFFRPVSFLSAFHLTEMVRQTIQFANVDAFIWSIGYLSLF